MWICSIRIISFNSLWSLVVKNKLWTAMLKPLLKWQSPKYKSMKPSMLTFFFRWKQRLRPHQVRLQWRCRPSASPTRRPDCDVITVSPDDLRSRLRLAELESHVVQVAALEGVVRRSPAAQLSRHGRVQKNIFSIQIAALLSGSTLFGYLKYFAHTSVQP